MKHLITMAILYLSSLLTCLFSAESSNRNRNLLNLITDWGYLENFHPLIITNHINADSIFCQFAEDIIKNKIKYSREHLLSTINKKSKIQHNFNIEKFNSIYDKNILAKNSKTATSDSLFKNKRVIYNDSTNQFTFYTAITNTQPFPSESLRILALSKIWNNYKFYYPYQDVLPNKKAYDRLLLKYINIILDSRNYSQYHLAIQSMTSEYRDTHSYSSSFIISHQLGTKTIPAKVRYLKHKLIIYDCYSKSLLDSTGLKIGDIIDRVNEEPIPSIFKRIENYIPFSNSTVLNRDLGNLSLKTNDDSLRLLIEREKTKLVVTVPTYTLNQLYKKEDIFKIPNALVKYNDSTLYISCGFVDTLELRRLLTTDRQLKWFIFDLRSYTNWIKPIVKDFFYPSKTSFASVFNSLPAAPGSFSEPRELTIGPSNEALIICDPHVIVLVNENTQSQGEFQAMFLQAIPNAITIGSRTAGADGNTSKFVVPGNITITITLIGVQYPDKKKTQQCGVRIDYRRSPNLKYAIKGIDAELEFALDLIKKGG